MTTNKQLIDALNAEMMAINNLSATFINQLKRVELVGRRVNDQFFAEIKQKNEQVAVYGKSRINFWNTQIQNKNLADKVVDEDKTIKQTF